MERLIPFILLISLSATPVLADSVLDKLQIHGFASQAFILTSDNSFYGDSEDGSTDYTELGLNFSYRVSPRIRIASQVLSRHAGEMDNGSPRIDYALADISLYSSDNSRFGSYIGRVKNQVGLYNSTRDVAHTRQGIFTAQTIYFDKVRDLSLSADAIYLYAEHYFPTGNLLYQAGIGYPVTDDNVEYVYLGRNWDGKLENNQLAYFANIMYEHDGGRWIFAASHAALELDFNAAGNDSLIGINSGQLTIDYSVFSIQFNAEKWQVTSELALQNIHYKDIGGALFNDSKKKPIGFSLQADYKFTPKWQSFIRYEDFSLDRNDRNGKGAVEDAQALNTQLGVNLPIIPNHTNYSRSWVIGGRWDINKNVMARMEYHTFDGTSVLSPRENNMATTKKDWDLFAVSLSYKF
ncbi:MAG: hypothetical protein COA90_01425 [Gammaproteobacteria bacterium]|nr:MAG: hypothetical protein COA90_01425 [Gammaproteobacteria bacterium]